MPGYDHLHDLDDDAYANLADPDRALGEIDPQLLELDKIPRRLWEQALTGVPVQLRDHLARSIPDEALRELACDLVMEMMLAEGRARQARDASRFRGRRTGTPLPAPETDHAVTRRTAQLNMRLRSDDYERLREAAVAVGMKPTTLARALVLNGVAKILKERGAT